MTHSMTPTNLLQAMWTCVGLAAEAVRDGNYPVAAVVLSADGTTLGEASSSLVRGFDPTAHPEVMAIRRAADAVQSRYLTDCWLVSTLEPCPMCTSAAIWAKFRGIAFGTSQPHAIAFGRDLNHPTFTFRQIPIRCAEIAAKGAPELEVLEGVASADTNALLEKFREQLRRVEPHS